MSRFAKLLLAVIVLLVGLSPVVFAQFDRTVGDVLIGHTVKRNSEQAAGLPTIAVSDLPPEALKTLATIKQGGPFPYPRDGIIFANREGRLPFHRRGYYREYTVKTPGIRGRGARRIIVGSKNEFYYTDDHYRTFKRIRE